MKFDVLFEMLNQHNYRSQKVPEQAPNCLPGWFIETR